MFRDFSLGVHSQPGASRVNVNPLIGVDPRVNQGLESPQIGGFGLMFLLFLVVFSGSSR